MVASEKDAKFYFGENNYNFISKKYVTYKSVIDNDNIIIRTNNIKVIKGNYVLIVDNNKVVYLKNWQVKSSSNNDLELDFYLVKLNRNFFKSYTFNSSFEGYSFEKEEKFDDLLEIAKKQDDEKISVKFEMENLF